MPNIASLLKSEIVRLARKELRTEIVPLRKAGAGYRREIAALKRKIANLERQLKQSVRSGVRTSAKPDADGSAQPTRFVAKGLRSMRARLGLSAPQLAQLLGVSTQSIYNWETKKAVPRKGQMNAIVALRSAGRRDVHQRLGAGKQKRKAPVKKRKRRR
jgi:DNA-binding transcriptional regulator YiaG